MPIELSFICPSIRLELLPLLYNSIHKAYSGEWEIVVISPYDQPNSMKINRVIWLGGEYANMTVCRQKGLIASKGEYVTWAADDAVYLPGSLDKAFTYINKNTVTSLMMTEGENWAPSTLTEPHYRAWFHKDLRLPFIRTDTMLLMFGVAPRGKMLAVGGWDCRFEQLGEADVDLSIRLRRVGLRYALTPFQVVKCDHMEGVTGDHRPVHEAHFENDLPLLREIYSGESSMLRSRIPLDNWKAQPHRWPRRWGV